MSTNKSNGGAVVEQGRLQFKAFEHHGGWYVSYLLSTLEAGPQKMITGETVNLPRGLCMWSGIRGGSEQLSEAEAQELAEALNQPGWRIDGGNVYAPDGTLCGAVQDTGERQPDDNFWVPRTVRAESCGLVEWFPAPDTFRAGAFAWVMLTTAQSLAIA